MKGIKLSGAPLYLDMQATTPLDPRVIDAMMPLMTEQYGNPHSRTHMYGWESEDLVESARLQVSSQKLPFREAARQATYDLAKRMSFFSISGFQPVSDCIGGKLYSGLWRPESHSVDGGK